MAGNVRVLTLYDFEDLTFVQLRSILVAFPNVQRLCLRICLPKRGIEWKIRMLGDKVFEDQEEGWLDKIHIDEKETDTHLYRWDEEAGTVVRSMWDLRRAFEHQIGHRLPAQCYFEGNPLIVPAKVYFKQEGWRIYL